MTPLVIGLDLSVTRTGLCVDGVPSSFSPPKGTLLERCRSIRDHIDEHVRYGADLAVIEAIGTRMTNTAIVLGGLHMLVLDLLEWRGIETVAVAPADLKKYATGRGNADKDVMLLAAARLEPAVTNNDEADAWWLHAIGIHVLGTTYFGGPQTRQDIIDKVNERRQAA
jgi:Holliday junction resolvasome RuvABC endonuclease subunit